MYFKLQFDVKGDCFFFPHQAESRLRLCADLVIMYRCSNVQIDEQHTSTRYMFIIFPSSVEALKTIIANDLILDIGEGTPAH